MQQKNESNYLEVISIEEYLTKRQKIREKQEEKEEKRTEKVSPAWMMAGLYV